MQLIKGNAIVVARNCGGILCHQVNCLGVAGGGIAKQIRDEFDRWYENYKARSRLLGNAGLTKVQDEPKLYIADLYGQFDFGSVKCYTDYQKLEDALRVMLTKREILLELEHIAPHIFIPYGIGCGLAGGKWERVYPILERVVPDAVIVQLP